ncbi:hypothetical protein T08_4388 [Trichinella sp. T8]|nr:hypothetical protein T08_4388 [Trichinella sp. T8]
MIFKEPVYKRKTHNEHLCGVHTLVRTLHVGALITNSTGIRLRAFGRICTHK